MDIHTAWNEFCAAMADRDRETVGRAADAIVGWLSKSGFFPTEWQEKFGTRERALMYFRDMRAVAEMQ